MFRLRRVLLNPCDWNFFGRHKLLVRDAPGGDVAYMMVDVDGHIHPDRMREILAGAMRAHPATMGKLRIALVGAILYWKIPEDLEEESRRAAVGAHVCHDMRNMDDWPVRLEEMCREHYGAAWDVRKSPQLRLEQYVLPDNRTRLCLRWPHLLMDAEGAQWFLSELGREPMTDMPSTLLPDEGTVDILAEQSLKQRWRYFRKGLSYQRNGSQGRINLLPLGETSSAPTEHRVLYRHWNAEQVKQMEANAKCMAPRLSARYLAACVIRALHRIYTEEGVETAAYRITMPVRVGISDPAASVLEKRPVPGNYLVCPTITGRREIVEDKRALEIDILRQLREYHVRRGDLAQWSMLWVATFIPPWFYSLIVKLPLNVIDYTSDFSFYEEIEQPLRSIDGARVTNIWGGCPPTTPPAWNPVFSRYQGKLSLALTWSHPAMSDELAHRYADYIEEELLAV